MSFPNYMGHVSSGMTSSKIKEKLGQNDSIDSKLFKIIGLFYKVSVDNFLVILDFYSYLINLSLHDKLTTFSNLRFIYVFLKVKIIKLLSK